MKNHSLLVISRPLTKRASNKPMEKFENKIAVVTGGGTGMGRELVLQLANEGCHVSMCDVIEENMDIDDALEEVSSMAGGNVAISVGKEDEEDKRKPTIFREDEELEEDRGVRGQPGSNYPSARDADDRTNEVDPETGKSGKVGPKYKIAKEQSEVEEIANYLLEAGVFIG